jgi:hypothetical protein
MELLEELKKCEPSVTQIAKDAASTRQAVYLWKDDRLPRDSVFNRLASMDKYKEALSRFDYKAMRGNIPYGRKLGSKTKNK